ncbi:MAG: hypothetical protein IJ168_00075 [Eubacterium sp.]|nr:hypothetical protein [Eubacterium sp.]
MKKNMEYKEPEFNVIRTDAQDVLTASGDGLLDIANSAWDTISHGGGIGFGL